MGVMLTAETEVTIWRYTTTEEEVPCPDCSIDLDEAASWMFSGDGAEPPPPCRRCEGAGFVMRKHTEKEHFGVNAQTERPIWFVPGDGDEKSPERRAFGADLCRIVTKAAQAVSGLTGNRGPSDNDPPEGATT